MQTVMDKLVELIEDEQSKVAFAILDGSQPTFDSYKDASGRYAALVWVVTEIENLRKAHRKADDERNRQG